MECSCVQLSAPCPLRDWQRQRGSVQVETAIIGCRKDASQYSAIRQLSLVLGSASASDCRISSLSTNFCLSGNIITYTMDHNASS
ncbi:hypothetical protein V496_01106 [Pseudogymnoascus sp. VKM F-4515 (FW-2607)]|nr:hypothetical protein V496_01106 [Pseudogymnoascus sp. VKM F-4515 (FW-2607)]